MADHHLSPTAPGFEDDDSDWEYEYSTAETESFYVTLDLSSKSSHMKQTARVRQEQPRGRVPRVERPVPTSPNATLENEDAEASVPPPDTPGTPSARQREEDGEANSLPDSEPTKPERIQILDLHTPNPLISYNGQLYSCDWTSTLGTDMLFTAPQPDQQQQSPPLRSMPKIDLLAATRIKLSARPVQALTRPSPPLPTTTTVRPTPAGAEVSTAPIVSPATTPSHPTAFSTPPPPSAIQQLPIPLGHAPSITRQNQGAFLANLIRMKHARGETDEVPVLVDAQGQRTQQHLRFQSFDGGLGDDDDDDDDGNDGNEDLNNDGAQVPSTSPAKKPKRTPTQPKLTSRGRPRGRRARRAASGAGLFRDYRSGAVDGGRVVIGTPERWTDLGDGGGGGGEPRGTGGGRESGGKRGGLAGGVTKPGVGAQAGDWRQRLSEHLHGGGGTVVLDDVEDNEDADGEKDLEEVMEVEMEDV